MHMHASAPKKILRIVGKLLTRGTTVCMCVVILLVSICVKARSRGYHMDRRIYIRLLHLLRTDHVSPDKFIDVVEVPGFRDSTVVIAVW